jgi:hypothetical protein
MDDFFKNLTIGFFAFLVLHGSLEQRSGNRAARQVREAFNHTGTVRARTTPRGMFGLFASDIYAVDVFAKGIETDRLPFSLVPRRGWKGRIKHLRLHFTNFTLIGLPIEQFDLGHAYWKERLVLRSAGTGPSSVKIGAAGLEKFLLRKYQQILSDVKVGFEPKKLKLDGRVSFLGVLSPFTATGQLTPRAGRYVDIVGAEFVINGQLMTPSASELLLRQFNPILDIENDLGLRGFFTITEVTIENDALVLKGRITVPKAETPAEKPGQPAIEPQKIETQKRGESDGDTGRNRDGTEADTALR